MSEREVEDSRAALCDETRVRVLASIAGLTITLRSQLPSYSRLSFDDQRRTVREMVDLLFDRIKIGMGPSADDLAYARRAAKRRAGEGVSAYDVLASFNVVTGVIWDALRESGNSSDALLLDLVAPLGRWSRQMSEAVVDAFSDAYPEAPTRQSELRENLFAGLGSGSDSARFVDLAHELGLDPAGDFQALCTPKAEWSVDELAILQRSSKQLEGVTHFGFRGDRLVGITQLGEIHQAASLLRETSGGAARVGVGLSRMGLRGAELSLEDAERALRVALQQDQAVADFESVWLESVVAESESRLKVLFSSARVTAIESPDLADAVIAFAQGGLTLAGASKLVGIHPNSVAYRLDRWRTLTGLDPRSYAGLTRSVLAVGDRQQQLEMERQAQ